MKYIKNIIIVVLLIALQNVLTAQTTEDCPCKNGNSAREGKECCGGTQDGEEYDPKDKCCENNKILNKTPISDLSKCPNRVAKEGHTPKFNGCGSYGIYFNSSKEYCGGNVVTTFYGACLSHDLCYDVCNNKQATCDNNFRDSMNAMCLNIIDYAINFPSLCTTDGSDYMDCINRASNYYLVVSGIIGQIAWQKSQKNACQCCE